MTAKVDILTATSEDALTVPVQAVVKRVVDDSGEEVRGSVAETMEESDVVYVIVDGKTVIRPVVTGVSDVLHVEITEGLTDGDEVVIGPYRTLKALASGESVRAERKGGGDTPGGNESDTVEVRIE
jgi:HlyD family secretion protein